MMASHQKQESFHFKQKRHNCQTVSSEHWSYDVLELLYSSLNHWPCKGERNYGFYPGSLSTRVWRSVWVLGHYFLSSVLPFILYPNFFTLLTACKDLDVSRICIKKMNLRNAYNALKTRTVYFSP